MTERTERPVALPLSAGHGNAHSFGLSLDGRRDKDEREIYKT
jgi:hypothetical protein